MQHSIMRLLGQIALTQPGGVLGHCPVVVIVLLGHCPKCKPDGMAYYFKDIAYKEIHCEAFASEVLSTQEHVFIKDLCTLLLSSLPRS